MVSETGQALQPLLCNRESDLVVLVEEEEEQEEQQDRRAYAGGENGAEELVWGGHDTSCRSKKKKPGMSKPLLFQSHLWEHFAQLFT